jgi:hypothetical protein
MSQLQHARSFRDLIVHQKARAVAKRIFQATMIEKAASFCGDPAFEVNESAADYLAPLTTDN